ncbi:MAG: hypothetical protein KJ558_09530 [Gammaproteobacteria bacterium]|nr:hypothetical protein [Gammaproteobacteria bacterium]MBU1655047.1 hypothetical protein [Gammaproteobacteria bacterium]MBU1961544.1 hypothetical protein [Gammaproteobacteria bacterium]
MALSALCLLPIAGNGQAAEYVNDGIYLNGNQFLQEKDVHYCTLRPRLVGIDWTYKREADSPTVIADAADVAHMAIDALQEFHLKGDYRGEIYLSFGTNILTWEGFDLYGFGPPCNDEENKDRVWCLKYYLQEPFQQTVEQGVIKYALKPGAKAVLQKYREGKFGGMPMMVAVWESFPGRRLDKGWIFLAE